MPIQPVIVTAKAPRPRKPKPAAPEQAQACVVTAARPKRIYAVGSSMKLLPEVGQMTKRRRHTSRSLPGMMVELTLASWETIGRRSLMMARGTCSPAEYARMVQEKAAAFGQSAALLARSRKAPSAASLMAPWHAKATANAKRLRRK